MNKVQCRKAVSMKLVHYREKHNLTQKAVAAYLGMKLRTYQSYEERRAEPSLFTLKTLADLYQIDTIDQLLDFPGFTKNLSIAI